MKSDTELMFRIWDPVNFCFEYHCTGERLFLLGMNGVVYDGNGCPYDENYKPYFATTLESDSGQIVYEGDIIEYYLGEGFSQTGPYRSIVATTWNKLLFIDPVTRGEDTAWVPSNGFEIIGNIYQGTNEN